MTPRLDSPSSPSRPDRVLARRVVTLGLAAIGVALVGCSDEPAPPADGPRSSAARSEAPPIWDLDELCAELSAGTNPYVGVGQITSFERRLAELDGEGADPIEIARVLQPLSDLYVGHDRLDDAIASLKRALAILEEHGPSDDRGPIDSLRMRLAIAHMRTGEVDHCIAMHNQESCLFPLSPAAQWHDPSGAIAAIEVLHEVLAGDAANLGAMWLLNVAHMAAGTWPDGVDERYLIEVPAEDDAGVGRLRDVAGSLGVDVSDGAGGVVLDDVDGDGLLDIVTSSIHPCAPLHYFRNAGDGTFEDWSERSGLARQLGGINMAAADYDGDGRLDLTVFRGAWMRGEDGRQRNSLLHQEADGTFTDVTREALGVSAFPSLAGKWADYDLDGDLDLFVGNEEHPCSLYRNEGDGTFTDVAEQAGVTNGGLTKGVAWGDYDDDGDPDLFVSNLGQANHFYRNDGDGTFTDIAEELGVAVVEQEAPAETAEQYRERRTDPTFTTWFWDYDNDGDLDLFVASFGANLSAFAADYMGKPSAGIPLRLFENDGAGGLRDVAPERGLARVLLPMGGNYGDVDNDGFLDIYLGTGKPDFRFIVPNVLYRNYGGERFGDVTTTLGMGHLQKGHAIAFGDVDNDGDQDVFAQMGGFYLADAFRNALFENPGNDNHWVTLRLRSNTKNRFAVGGRLKVTASGPDGTRDIHLLVDSGGSFGFSSLQQEVGLGNCTRIERVEMRWPTSGATETFTGIEVDGIYTLVEGAGVAKKVELASFALKAD